MASKICFASIDVEHDFGEIKEFKGVENLDKILDIFKKYNISATLFVTGEVLEKYGHLIKNWSKSYEIACHSFSHRFWNGLNSEERRVELEKFINLYQQIFQKIPRGFRAPSHLIDEEGLKLLNEKGFLYDSSIVPHYPPFKKYRGYRGRAPLNPYRSKGLNLLEIPVRGQIFGIPLAGVWIARLPTLFYKLLFLIYRPSFVTINMHSWDIFGREQFLAHLEEIIKLLKKVKYSFYNGEQVFENRR